MAGLGSIVNLARIARLAALLLFLTPWTSASCSSHGLAQLTDGAPTASSDEVPLASASGVQLATGSVSYADSAPFSSAMDEVSQLFGKPNPLVGAAALLILLSLAASVFVRGAGGVIAAAIGTALATGALSYVVLIEIPSKAEALFNRLAGSRAGMEIHIHARTGFYLCLAALVAALVCDLLAMQQRRISRAPSVSPEG